MSTVTFMHRPKDVEGLHRQLSVEVMTARLSKVGTVTSADGRFEVLDVLGHGASSVVCDVLDTKLNRRVALKLFPGLADDRLARGVKGEAQRIAAISHPNIVVVHDYDVLKLMPGEHRCFYVAMELGVSLTKWFEQPRSQEEILATFGRAGEGLAAIHAAGFVYRDFKSANVVLVAGVPKIVDFGLALSAAAGEDASRARVGTPPFMSPEALAGRPQDARSDQFSFAAALWQSLSGELPYEPYSEDPDKRRPLRRPRAPLPEGVLEVLLRALDPVPERRFADMPALLAALPVAETARGSSPSGSVPALRIDTDSSPEPARGSSTTAPSLATDSPSEPARGASATGPAPTVDVETDATTELRPARRSSRRGLAPWLAFPAAGALSVVGVLAAMGFWDAPRAAEPEAPTHEALEVVAEPAVVTAEPAPEAACPDRDVMLGVWNFSTTAEWAEQTHHLGKIGKYTLELTREGSCGLRADLRKLGNNKLEYTKTPRDVQRVDVVWARPFTGGFAGTFAPRKEGEAIADHTYAFDFIVDGEVLYGDFHAETADSKHRFSGVIRGARATDAPTDSPLPCPVLCGARCLGASATAECRRTCTTDAWAEATCSAPDPAAKVSLPARSGSCHAAAGYAGRWLFLARDRASQEQRAYEVELRAAGCGLVVVSARDRARPAVSFNGTSGQVDSSGLWKLELTSGRGKQRVRHAWSLVGRDYAFGEFTARHDDEQLAAGVLAAYRRP